MDKNIKLSSIGHGSHICGMAGEYIIILFSIVTGQSKNATWWVMSLFIGQHRMTIEWVFLLVERETGKIRFIINSILFPGCLVIISIRSLIILLCFP